MIQLYHGDCRKFLVNEIEADSIDLTITSPPYDNLRTYNNSSTWGWAEFCGIASGLWRVTKPGGVVVWVVGDATIKGSETGSSFEQALAFKKMGFNLHDTMVYQKANYLPKTHNRYEQEWEYCFVFSKQKPKAFNPIKVPIQYPRNRVLKMRNGDNRDKISKQNSGTHRITGNIWKYKVGGGHISTDNFAHKHPAPFPEKLADDHIISWSNPWDVILDPFMGSGTTGKMALLNNRHFIGCEIDSEYFQIAKDRIEAAEPKTEEIETA